MPETISFRQQAELVQQFCLDEYERISTSENPNKLEELAKLTQFKLDAMEFFQRKVQDEFQTSIYKKICDYKTGGNKKEMNKLTTFTFESLPVRTTTIDGEPWLVGKDVAEILGYQNASKALADHVDDEDKLDSKTLSELNNESLSSLGQRGAWLINESGVYSLIFGSKLPEAKKFKHWVTSEVLPTLRKTGEFKIPKTPLEHILLTQQALLQVNDKVDNIATDVKQLKDDANLTNQEYTYLNHMVKKCVEQSKMLFTPTINTVQSGMLYRTVSSDLNKFAGVRFRNQIRKGQFDEVCKYLEDWKLSPADFANIKRAGEEHADVA